MEWQKMKTVLICLFLAVNIFLGVNLQIQQQRKYIIPSDLVDDVIAVLNTKQVKVEKTSIPLKRIGLRGYLFLTVDQQEENTAKRILGDFEKNEEKNTFSNGKNLLSFSSQSDVCFTGLWKHYRYQYSAKGVKAAAEIFLQDLCDNSLELIQRKIEFDPANDVYKMEYGQTVDGIDIVDTKITVWANKEGITKAEGTIVFTPCYPYEKGQLCDSFNSLLKYSLLDEVQNSKDIVMVSGVRPVYTIGQKDTANVLYAGWEISAPGRNKIYFNAITGEQIK